MSSGLIPTASSECIEAFIQIKSTHNGCEVTHTDLICILIYFKQHNPPFEHL